MPLISVRDVTKSYGGLRPFRLRALDVDAGELVVLNGMDRQSASVLTDLLTGATLPDNADGSVSVHGQATSLLAGQDEWLAFLDRFGLVNDRVVLLDELTVAANLAVPLTLEIDPIPVEVRRAVDALAGEIGLDSTLLDARLHEADPMTRLLVRLGRAVAQNPPILVVEHPTIELTRPIDVRSATATLRRVVDQRRIAAVVALADPRVPPESATRFLSWQAGSGELSEWRRRRGWFS
jgi:ABC-type transporter Mla maintaining outer membrane lipid asymmetry ATPase subunit MlaF